MRCVAGLGVVALVGCNQVLGIGKTQPFDASADVAADMPHVVLDWQIATLLPSGAPSSAIAFAPIDPPPRVRITTLDRPFAATAAGDPDQTSYSTGDGWIRIPSSYQNATWRLEYTLAGGVPHEVQWAPDDKQGHLTVPRFGRLQRDAVPAGAGYTIMPSPARSYTFPRVFTTGLWTEGFATATGATVDYKYDTGAVSLDGAKGRPDPAAGDRALLVDFVTDAGCRVAVGSAALASAAIQVPPRDLQTPTWDAARKSLTSAPVGLPFIARFGAALGKLESRFVAASSKLVFGYVASTDMPGLAGTPDPLLLGMQLPVPVMLTLLQCPYSATLPDVAQPMSLDGFPRVVHVQLVDARDVLGVTLSSGMETVTTSALAPGTTTLPPFAMAFPAPMPTRMTLTTSTTPPGQPLDLAGDSDQLAAGPAAGVLTLAFVPEVGADLRSDYYDVVLHRIAGGVLTTERIYTVTAPQVRIDGATLATGADYVFEIRSYKGHPKALHGDFSAVDYPYGLAIVFTRTFKTS